MLAGLKLAALALVAAGPSFSCQVVSVHDGDTMRCADGVRIRLQGIDANELDGGCHITCASLSASAARDRLRALASGKPALCSPTGTSYRRITAWCSVAGRDLSCEMVRSGGAIVWTKFDPGGRLRTCQRGVRRERPMMFRRYVGRVR